MLMHCNHVLFLLLPVELFTLILPRVLYFLTFLLEPLMCQIIYFLNVMHVLFAFVLSMIVYFEGTLGAHEVGIGLGVVVGGDLLPVECEAYYRSDIVLRAVHALLDELVQAFVLPVEVVRRQVKSIHVLLATR